MDIENFTEVTTKFNELKKWFNTNYNACAGICDYRVDVLKNAMNELLNLLDEMVRK